MASTLQLALPHATLQQTMQPHPPTMKPPFENLAPSHSHGPTQLSRENTNTMPTPTSHPQEKPYTHPSLKALTLNTRDMHTTILDLQNILTIYTDTHIIAQTETKHRHIKSIWRQPLRNYKLVYNPSLYDKHTKRCYGGTILATHKDAYPTINPLHVPPLY